MPRKLRLSIQPKNLFRKLRAQRSGYTTTVSTSQCFPVSIALETVSVLKISIPREVYIETPAESLTVLQHRLAAHNIDLYTQPVQQKVRKLQPFTVLEL